MGGEGKRTAGEEEESITETGEERRANKDEGKGRVGILQGQTGEEEGKEAGLQGESW